MKKLLSIITFSVLCLTLSAQSYVGGSLGIAVQSQSLDGESMTNQVYSFSPEYGYMINDVWTVGASIGIQYNVVAGNDDITTFGISPFVRATFAALGPVKVFTDGVISYEQARCAGESAYGFGFGIRPGLWFDASERVSLFSRAILFQFGHLSYDGYGVNTASFAIPGTFELGFAYRF